MFDSRFSVIISAEVMTIECMYSYTKEKHTVSLDDLKEVLQTRAPYPCHTSVAQQRRPVYQSSTCNSSLWMTDRQLICRYQEPFTGSFSAPLTRMNNNTCYCCQVVSVCWSAFKLCRFTLVWEHEWLRRSVRGVTARDDSRVPCRRWASSRPPAVGFFPLPPSPMPGPRRSHSPCFPL